jgi:hypothetical protein
MQGFSLLSRRRRRSNHQSINLFSHFLSEFLPFLFFLQGFVDLDVQVVLEA